MTKICEAIELLSDGEWHKVKDLQEKLGLNDFKTKLLVEFLVNYDFCLLTGVNRVIPLSVLETGRLKLRTDMLVFLEMLDKLEGET